MVEVLIMARGLPVSCRSMLAWRSKKGDPGAEQVNEASGQEGDGGAGD